MCMHVYSYAYACDCEHGCVLVTTCVLNCMRACTYVRMCVNESVYGSVYMCECIYTLYAEMYVRFLSLCVHGRVCACGCMQAHACESFISVCVCEYNYP